MISSWQFFSTRLYHVDSVLSTSYCQFKKRLLCLFLELGWWPDFSINTPTCTPAVVHQMNIWDRKCQWWTKHNAIGANAFFSIIKKAFSVDDLHFITKPSANWWTDWTVDQTRCQGHLLKDALHVFIKPPGNFQPHTFFLRNWLEVGRNLGAIFLDMSGSSQDQLTHRNAPQPSHLLA